MNVWTAAAFVLLLLLCGASNSSSGASAAATADGASVRARWLQPLTGQAHAFYYLWYGADPATGTYKHWNHAVLEHWSAAERDGYPHGMRFQPPDDLHSPFYPLRGPYSSDDPATIRGHVREMLAAKITTMVVSWWGPAWREGTHDTQGVNTDAVLGAVVRELQDLQHQHHHQQQPGGAAGAAGASPRLPDSSSSSMTLAFHMEPYPNRSVETVREDLAHLVAAHGSSPVLLRDGRGRPVYYMYDHYRIGPEAWARLLAPGGDLSVRNTALDGVFIALMLEERDGADILAGGFDGVYTYFASEAVSWASQPANWPAIARWADQHSLLFVASVGPGYDDAKIRPWNAAATRDREGGERYRRAWRAAAASGARAVSITSWNEWGEGTQVEPAAPWPRSHAALDAASSSSSRNQDYGPGGPWLYTNITRDEASQFGQAWHDASLAAAQEASSGGGSGSKSASGLGVDTAARSISQEEL